MRIILVSGLDRSGKSTIGNYFSKFLYKKIELGGLLRDIIKHETHDTTIETSAYYENNKTRLEIIAMGLIEKEVKNIPGGSKGLVIIGARSATLRQKIKLTYPETLILYVTADLQHRYNRYKENAGSRPNELFKSHEDFLHNDRRQTLWGIESFQSNADFVISNNGSLFNLQRQFLLFIKSISDV